MPMALLPLMLHQAPRFYLLRLVLESVEVKVGSENNYTVNVTEKQTILSDVVVVGYGKSSRRNLSSSVTTLRPEDLNRGAIGDVGQLLQGKVAGLNITSSGDPTGLLPLS